MKESNIPHDLPLGRRDSCGRKAEGIPRRTGRGGPGTGAVNHWQVQLVCVGSGHRELQEGGFQETKQRRDDVMFLKEWKEGEFCLNG